jgi:hypothetical protein
MRILGGSASLGMLVTLALAGCGGGAPTGETPKATVTTVAPAPATPPTTAGR